MRQLRQWWNGRLTYRFREMVCFVLTMGGLTVLCWLFPTFSALLTTVSLVIGFGCVTTFLTDLLREQLDAPPSLLDAEVGVPIGAGA